MRLIASAQIPEGGNIFTRDVELPITALLVKRQIQEKDFCQIETEYLAGSARLGLSGQ